jgi:hypothetical protein
MVADCRALSITSGGLFLPHPVRTSMNNSIHAIYLVKFCLIFLIIYLLIPAYIPL